MRDEIGAPPDAGALVFAWESGASEAAGKPIGLRRKERQDLYDLVRVFARIHQPGPERAAALQRTVARYVAYVRTLDAAERRYHPVTPAAVMAWLNEGSLEAAAEAESPDRASGVRKASEPQRATFIVPPPNGAAGGGGG